MVAYVHTIITQLSKCLSNNARTFKDVLWISFNHITQEGKKIEHFCTPLEFIKIVKNFKNENASLVYYLPNAVALRLVGDKFWINYDESKCTWVFNAFPEKPNIHADHCILDQIFQKYNDTGSDDDL